MQVVGTVSRITRQAATLSLLTVDGRPCRPDFAGVIRQQDVRQTAKDSVKVRNVLWLVFAEIRRLIVGMTRCYRCGVVSDLEM